MNETPLQTAIRLYLEADPAHSMRSLSLKAGVNETAVKAIMRGKSKSPRGDTVSSLARLLGLSVAVLLGEESFPADYTGHVDHLAQGEPMPAVEPSLGDRIENADELALIKFWRRLTRTERHVMTSMLQNIGLPDRKAV